MIKKILFIVLSVCIFTNCGNKEKTYIEIFAGSASKPSLEKISSNFENETGVEVRRIYGGSGSVLSSMILSGRGDIYLPGSHDFMEIAVEKGIADKNTIRIIAYLVPVIAVQKGNPRNIRSLDDLLRKDVSFAVGNPQTVCVGLYAVEVFEKAGLVLPLRGKVSTYAENCEKTATFITLKAVDAVIGWDVFGKWNPDEIDIVQIDRKFVQRSAYIPAAVTLHSKNRLIAEKFMSYLTSETGKNIYRRAGYIVSEDELTSRFGNLKTGGRYSLHDSWK